MNNFQPENKIAKQDSPKEFGTRFLFYYLKWIVLSKPGLYSLALLSMLLLNGCISLEFNNDISSSPLVDSDKSSQEITTKTTHPALSIEKQEIETVEREILIEKSGIDDSKGKNVVNFTESSAMHSLQPEVTQSDSSDKEFVSYEPAASREEKDGDPQPVAAKNMDTPIPKDNGKLGSTDVLTKNENLEDPPPQRVHKKEFILPGNMEPPELMITEDDRAIGGVLHPDVAEKETTPREPEVQKENLEIAKLTDIHKEHALEETIKPIPPIPAIPEPIRYGGVSGRVSILSRRKNISPENVMIVVKSLGEQKFPPKKPQVHTIRMRGKKYLPRYNIIRKGDSVEFKNADPFMHNVFSLSDSNKFDLGTYGKGALPSHTFENEGIAKVYCNIHPRMACFIMVTSHDWGVITGKDGTFQFESLPAGQYEILAWNIRGQFSETIEIEPDQDLSFDIQIESSRYRKKQHKNKYGKKYPKKSFDEFYQ